MVDTIKSKFRVLEGNKLQVVKDNQSVSRVTIRGDSGNKKIYIKEKLEDSFSDSSLPLWEGTTSAVDMILTADSNNNTKAKFRVLEGNKLKDVKDNQPVSRVTIRGDSIKKIYIKEKLDDDFDNAIWEGTTSAVDMIPSIVTEGGGELGEKQKDLFGIIKVYADSSRTIKAKDWYMGRNNFQDRIAERKWLDDNQGEFIQDNQGNVIYERNKDSNDDVRMNIFSSSDS